MRFIKKLVLLTILLLLVSASVIWIYGIPHLAEKKINDLFATYDFGSFEIGEIGFQDGLVYKDILFDEEGFTRIGRMKADTDWLSSFSGNQFYKNIALDDVVITSELQKLRFLDVAGIFANLLAPHAIGNITLQNGQLDLLSDKGAIRLNAKAHITKGKQVDDTTKINLALFGEQYQLTLNSKTEAQIHSKGLWQSNTEIETLRLNLDEISVSRAQGWLVTENKSKSSTPVISGQITAGAIKIGEKSQFGDTTVTVNGPINHYSVIIQAAIFSHPDIELTADLTMNGTEPLSVMVTLSSPNADDLFSFLQNIKEDLENIPSFGDMFTNLLITEGNIKRLKQEVSAINYDEVQVLMEGSMLELTGKVVAKKRENGVYRSYVLSMNPGAQ